MKTLFIDNHSKHKEELISFFKNVTVIPKEEISLANLKEYDLVVISGGSNVPSVFNNPEEYDLERKLVKRGVPILGVCLGCEVIVDAFGGTLKDFGEIHRGEVDIILDDSNLKNCIGQDSLNVYEAHTIGIESLPETFSVCGHSSHGAEIIRHTTLPIIGIQFHPEVGKHQNIFDWILQELKII